MTITNLAFANSDFGLNFFRLRKAVAQLRKNAAPPFADGYYHCITDPVSGSQVMSDPEWQSMNQFTGRGKLEAGMIDETRNMGVITYITQNNFITNSSIYSVGSTTVSVAHS